jgi:hypothetical protein
VARTPEAAPLVVIGEDPLVLSGPPTALTGRVHLYNPGERRVVLRDAGLRDPSGVLELSGARHAVGPLVLGPDQAGSMPLSIALDSTTPQGSYELELAVGGRAQRVVLHVAEAVQITVEPRTVVVLNRPGEVQRKRLVVRNDGNVVITVGEPTLVDLREDPLRYRALRVALEPLLRRERPDLDELAVALLAIARDEERVGAVAVRAPAPVRLGPGETEEVEIEVRFQDELPPERRYRGRLPVVTADVDLVVVASGGAVPGEEPAPSRPRPRRANPKRSSAKRGAEP